MEKDIPNKWTKKEDGTAILKQTKLIKIKPKLIRSGTGYYNYIEEKISNKKTLQFLTPMHHTEGHPSF